MSVLGRKTVRVETNNKRKHSTTSENSHLFVVQSSRCRVFRDDTGLEVGFQNMKSLTSHAKQGVWTLKSIGEPVRENWMQQGMESG